MRALPAVLLATVLSVLVTGCGFQLRGAQPFPFDSVFVNMPETSELGANLKRSIRGAGSARLADNPKEAQVTLTPTSEVRDKSILSLNSAGRTREFRLRYQFGYRLHDAAGRDLITPVSITQSRDYSFDDASVNAKEQEESLLWRDMQNDLLQQIMRRLAATRLKPAGAEPR